MRWRQKLFPVIIVAALVLVHGVLPAAAAFRNVPGSYPTIQAAVWAADPGDTVLVNKGGGSGPRGAYKENVVLFKALTIKCLKRAVIDVSNTATTIAGTDYSAAISVRPGAAGTKIKGCVIKNSHDCNVSTTPACLNTPDLGEGLDIDVNDVLVKGNFFYGNNTAVALSGDRFRIVGNLTRGNASGLVVQGSDGLISGNRVFGTFGTNISVLGNRNTLLLNKTALGILGILANGNDYRVSGNTVRNSMASGFVIAGPAGSAVVTANVSRFAMHQGFSVNAGDVSIRNNRAVGGNVFGFIVGGTNLVVRDNESESSSQWGIYLAGNNLTVERNRAKDSGMTGIFTSAGNLLSFKDNRSDGSFQVGMILTCGAGSCGPVTGNIVLNSNNIGMETAMGAPTLFSGNIARRNGIAGFRDSSAGVTNTWRANESSGNSGDGFLFLGDGHTVRGNLVVNNGGDGIDIDSTAATGFVIDGNVVLDNAGTGIENDAQLTDIVNNRVRRNGTDIAGAGDETPATGTVGSFNNNFGTGGPAAVTPHTGLHDPL